MSLTALNTLINATAQNNSQFKGLSAAYGILLGGTPSIAGYTALINANNSSNFGAGGTTVFNDENIYINTINALYQGNPTAKAAFDAIVSSAATIQDALTLVYNFVIPASARTEAGLNFFKSQATFYATRAAELGVAGTNGTALVAFASLTKIAVDNDIGGLGDTINDLKAAVGNGTAAIPADGSVFTPLETADGTQFDVDDVVSGANQGLSYNLTKGIDNIPGTAGNDTILASWSAAADQPFGALDVVDGSTGTDTLKVADSATAAGTLFSFGGATIKNVETIELATTGSLNGLDVSKISGLTSLVASSSDAAAVALTLADTTNATVTTATTNNSTISGGKSVSVTKGAAAGGTLGVSGKALTDVTIKGGAGAVTINNTDAAAAANKGTTLTSVTLEGVDADTGVGGEGLATLTIKGATTAARTVTVTNAKADHALTINVDGTGYKTDGNEVQTVVVDSVAKSLTVNATGAKSSLSIAGSTTATALTITGSAALKAGVNLANLKTIDGSAATGALNLGTINAATTSVKTGSGADAFSLGAAKVTVDAGAGDDTVTLTGAIAAESTVTLGAGNDKLLNNGGSVATSTKTTIDGGDGTDSLSASLINAGNAAQFKNFELLDISAAANLDVDLMTGSTITGLTLSGVNVGAATVSNVAKGAGLSVAGDNTAASHTINVKGAAAATDDTFAITFAGAAATTAPGAATIKAGTVVLNGIETVSIASSGGANTWNSIALTDDKLKVVTITGDKNLDLTFVGTNGTNTAANAGGAVNSIDGSAATGKLNINTTNVTADDKAGVGLTVKGGTAADTITLAQKATVLAGAGDDVITVAAAGATLTGEGGNDKFDVSAAVTGNATIASAVVVTITDFTKAADSIQLANATGTTTFVTTKVDISTATNLQQAIDLAAATNVTANDARVTWFNYGSDTYVVQDLSTATTLAATDLVVKLTGVLDLSTAAVSAAELLTWS